MTAWESDEAENYKAGGFYYRGVLAYSFWDSGPAAYERNFVTASPHTP